MNDTDKLIMEYGSAGFDLMDDDEEFKYISHSKGYYVSTLGRVFKELTKGVDGRNSYPKFLTPKTNKKTGRVEFNIVYLDNPSKSVRCDLIKVMAECFIPNPNGFKYVIVIDGNEENTIVSNLKWSSKRKTPIIKSKPSSPKKRLPYYDQYVWVKDFGWRRYTLEDASNVYNIPITDILDVTNNENKTGIIENISWLNRDTKHKNMVPNTSKGIWEPAPPHLFDVIFTLITPKECEWWYKQ